MGTRNLTMVISGGKPRIAQYGQWDGYPSGQGATVLNFLKEVSIPAFKKALEKCEFITDEKIRQYYKEVGADGSGWVNLDISNKFKQKHPQLDRDMAADVLKFVMDAQKKVELQNSSDFIKDGLFCEWAYIINLDKMTLEVKNGAEKTYSIKKLPTLKTFIKQLTKE